VKIIVLNGSPKGNESATMQYILYIQKKFPQYELKILNISQQIKKLEKNKEKFEEIIEDVKNSNGIIWGFPLYVMLVPSQYKRFIELITERHKEEAFKNKYTAVLATSIHFYDHTAINYMNAICDDLEMKYIGSFSADMFDLMIPNKRKQLILYAENLFYTIENKLPTSRKNLPFQNCFSTKVEVVNIYDLDIKGGCLGCIQCGYDNICVYKDKDEFTEFWSIKLESADILVFAGNIVDRYLSSRWKMVFDRSFFNGHIPTLRKRQFGFLISGPLGQIPNLRQIIESLTELEESNLVDIITDEYADSKIIDSLIHNLAKKLITYSQSGYKKPQTFLSVGGNKIFRDAIYGRMRFVFQADHRYYEEHGFYDFPHDDKHAKKMNDKFIPLTQDEKFRKVFYSVLKTEMIKPLKSVVDNPDK